MLRCKTFAGYNQRLRLCRVKLDQPPLCQLTSHLCAQCVILSMSDCKIFPTSAGSPTVIDKLVSSAKRLIFARISSTISFT